MTAKVLKRSRAKFVSKQIVDQMGLTLQALPEKTPDTLSLRQTIERLREPIEAALAKGYNYEELVPMLAQEGINIQPSTLKRYVLSGGDRSARKRSTTGKTKTRQSRKQSEDTASIQPMETQLTVDLTELSEPESPTPRKRGRSTTKASPASTAKAATSGRTRSTSTRRGRSAK
jgi:hypothetical protein